MCEPQQPIPVHAPWTCPPRNHEPQPCPRSCPFCCSFHTLDLPDPASLPLWGRDALATSFEQARDIFNAGMLRYKAALEHYLLDGCVTEHCNIVMEISNMYR